MNVQQLKEALDQLIEAGQGEMDIMFSYNYGDHWHTTVAVGVTTVEEQHVVHSPYHSMDKVVEVDEDDEPGSNSEVREVIILS